MSKQIKCRSCKKIVSSKAKRCPHCGIALKLPISCLSVITGFALIVFAIIYFI